MDARGERRPARDLLAATRRELRDLPGFERERERALVERILAGTTRSPAARARRRGPWIALAGAAAVLAAASVLALRARGTTPSAAGPAPELARATPTAPLPPAPAASVADVLAAARAELAAAASATPRTRASTAVAADAPLELRLLEARARGLRERRWDPWLREVALADAGTLSLALWCEVQLDRYVLAGDRPPAWKQAVGILRRDLERPETPRESSRLLAHALGRARDYGLADGVEVARLEPDGHLWSREWFDDLDAAGHEAGVAGNGMWRAWVDWRGR